MIWTLAKDSPATFFLSFRSAIFCDKCRHSDPRGMSQSVGVPLKELIVSIPLTSNRVADNSGTFTNYLVNVSCGSAQWSIAHRYSRFLQLHQGVEWYSVEEADEGSCKINFPESYFLLSPRVVSFIQRRMLSRGGFYLSSIWRILLQTQKY